MAETTPFLTADAFAGMIAPRVMTAAERSLVELLVQAASEWIRGRLPDLPVGSPQAKLVLFDLAAEALGPLGVERKAKSVTRETDNRSTTITYADALALCDMRQERYYELLGISISAEPRATFDSFETAFTPVDVCGRRQW